MVTQRVLWYSADGSTWSRVYADDKEESYISDISASDREFLAVGATYPGVGGRGASPLVLRSVDGRKWTSTRVTGPSGPFEAVAASGDRAVAIAPSDTERSYLSAWSTGPDGDRVVELDGDRPTEREGVGSVTATDQGFVVLADVSVSRRTGERSAEYTSADGVVWDRRSVGIERQPGAIVVAVGNRLVALGSAGQWPVDAEQTAAIEPWDTVSVWTRPLD